MSLRIEGKMMSSQLIAENTDEAFSMYQIPQDGILESVEMNVRLISEATIPWDQAVYFGVSGYVLPVLDPDTGITQDVLWDNQVPKDNGIGSDSIDLNTASTSAIPEMEPGLPNLAQIFDVGRAPHRLYKHEQMITLPDSPIGVFDASPDSYYATKILNIRLQPNIRVSGPSVVIFGLSNPLLNNMTTAKPQTFPDEKGWVRLQYLQNVLELAFRHAVGLTESGAETPWEEAAALIRDVLEPTIHEETAGDFTGVSWQLFHSAKYGVRVPGEIGNIGVLKAT